MVRRREPLAVSRQVSPLELFFDLVFVLAVGQLTHHLIEHLTWRGAAETAVALVAVCGVWTFTTFEVTLLDIEHTGTRVTTLVVMGLGLFMNAGITHAFDTSPWLFVAPMLAAVIGPAAYAALTAPAPHLRGHFNRVLIWLAMSTPLWLLGAVAGPELRLRWWAVAAAIDLLGTFTAHPLPGRSARTESLRFDADHMLERMRLFVIILLGETVLTLGRVLSEHHSELRTVLAALGTFIALVCLWAIYFGRAEQIVVSHATSASDPIREVHLAINAIYGVVASLVVFAAGTELLISHTQRHAGIGGVLVLTGATFYLLVHALYFHTAIRHGSRPRAIGTAVLAATAAVAYWLPPLLVIGLMVGILAALAATFSRGDAA